MAKTSTFPGSRVISLARRCVYMSQHGHRLRPPSIRPEASEQTDVCTLPSGTHFPVQRRMAGVQAPAFDMQQNWCNC